MDEYRSDRGDRPQGNQTHPNSEVGIRALTEEQLLQSISAHAPLPEVLNKICIALDCQIGNVVSLISLPEDDASKHAGIAISAERFGLHIFCSESIVADEELLGFLEMYSCVARLPSPRECRWIKQAACLAAIALKRDMEAGQQGGRVMHQNRPARTSARTAGFHP
ncbi:MAG: hypothetical protein WA876_14485 [Candidatus Acidiferrales bacterium]